MADNVNITAGAGTTIATDQCGTDHYQKVKLVDGTADSTTVITAGGGVEAGALRVTIASDSTGVVSIDDNGGVITVDGTLAAVTAITNALPAGTALLGKIGIDQVTANANEIVIKSGTVTAVTAITNAVAITNADITSCKTALELLDNSVDGNYLNINMNIAGTDVGAGAAAVPIADGGNTITVDGTVAVTGMTACNTGAVVLAAGTAEIGKLAAGTAEIGKLGAGTAEIGKLAAGTAVIGHVINDQAAITGYGQAKLDHADVTAAQVLVAAVADKKFYITSIIFSVAAAGSYWIEDDDAAQITCKWTLAANGGLAVSFPIDTPFKSTTVSKGLKVKGSAAGVIGCMITYYTLA